METQTLITLLIVGIILSKAIIAALIIVLVLKNRALKKKQENLQLNNALLEAQRDQIFKYNEELKSSEQFKIKVLSIASHDLRTPFVSIEMLLNSVAISLMKKEDLHDILLDVARQVSISRKMIDEVLLWTESQLRDNLENKETFNIVQQIQNIIPLFNVEIDTEQIILQNNIPPTLEIHMCKDIFSFVLRNILSNAVKFCHNKGVIRIGISTVEKNRIQLFIENEGQEPSTEILENLNTKSSWTYQKAVNNRGAGLGISLCKDLLKRIGGELQFEPKLEGGLRVNISFSAAQEMITNEIIEDNLVEKLPL